MTREQIKEQLRKSHFGTGGDNDYRLDFMLNVLRDSGMSVCLTGEDLSYPEMIAALRTTRKELETACTALQRANAALLGFQNLT